MCIRDRGTANQLAKWSSTSAIADSSIQDTGSLVTISNPTNVTGKITAQADLELDADLIDVNGNTGTAGQLLSSLGTGNGVDWIDAPVSYTKWVLEGDNVTTVDVTDGLRVDFQGDTGITTSVTAGTPNAVSYTHLRAHET